MTKAEFIDKMHIHNPQEDNKAQTARALDAFVEAMKETMAAGESVTLPGLGTFKVAARAARAGRNPKTGEAIQIAASKTVKFTPGKGLKAAL